MKKLFVVSFLVFHLSLFTHLNAQIISTFAGSYRAFGYSGNGGPATGAELYDPVMITTNVSGDIYIVDQLNNVIRKVNTAGTISTIAGNGYQAGTGHGGYSGDGGSATIAELATPAGIVIDNTGNIYISDLNNNVVRKVNTFGIISTIAGNFSYGGGYSGDGGPATDAELHYPAGLALDVSGNLYIVDCDNSCIRKVNSSGIITLIAGKPDFPGYSGNGGPATNAEFYSPNGLCFDGLGNLYIADGGNNVIRKVDTAGIISTVAGNGHGSGYSGDGGPAMDAEFFIPWTVAVDYSNNFYISDSYNNRIRKVDAITGIVTTIAGNGYQEGTGYGGYSGNGGPATAAELWQPLGVCFDNSGNMYIADADNNVIREVTDITGISDIKQENSITIYPNPSNGTFTLSLSNITEKCTIEIYNIVGEKVFSQLTMDNGQLTINLNNQPNGIYFYRVLKESGGLVGEGKVVVEK